MAAVAGLRTATSMLYYSAQRYDPQLRQQQPTLPPTPLILLGHLPISFRTSRISYSPSIFSRIAAILTRPGTPSLPIQDGSTTSSSNRNSSSRWHDEYSGRISTLTNTTIFESGDSRPNSPAGDIPALVKEPESGERQTPSIQSMLSAMRLGARVCTPPPSCVIHQPGDTIEEADEKGKDEEIVEQVPSDPEIPDLALITSKSRSHILDQHPEYDSEYDYSEKDDETISDFLVGQDPDDHVGDTYSFGQSISMSDVQVSVYSNPTDNMSPNRPPSVASWSSSSVRFRASSVTPSASSIRFRHMGPSTLHRQETILPGVYERREQVNSGGPTSFNRYGTAVPFRRVTFADPVSVPLPPIPRAHKAVAWWRIGWLNKWRTRFYPSHSRQQHPESTNPVAPSQPIFPAAHSIANLEENTGAHPPQPPSSPRSTAHSIRHRRTRFNPRRIISVILPCIPISQEPDESSKAEPPRNKLCSGGIFSNLLGHLRKQNKNSTPNVQDMEEVKTFEVQVNRRAVVE